MDDTAGTCPECGADLDTIGCSCAAPKCDKCGAPMPESRISELCEKCEKEVYHPIGIAAVLDQIMERFK